MRFLSVSFPPVLTLAAAVVTGSCAFSPGRSPQTAPPSAPLVTAFTQRAPAQDSPARPSSPAAALSPGTPPPASAAPSGAPYYYTSVLTTAPVVALTFDDGPHPTLTPRLLDILKQHDTPATFFVIGRNVQTWPAVARRIVAEGHEIANHSWSHPNLATLSDEAVLSQITRASDAIRQATGVTPRLFRPPYGAFTQRQRVMAFERLGLPSILWSVDPLDWKIRSAPSVRSRLVSGAHPGGILLAHDIHPSTIEAVPAVIADLKSRGYRFVTVSRLLEISAASAAGAAPVARLARPAVPEQ